MDCELRGLVQSDNGTKGSAGLQQLAATSRQGHSKAAHTALSTQHAAELAAGETGNHQIAAVKQSCCRHQGAPWVVRES